MKSPTDRRAVESLVGFVLVFSLITSSVGAVYVFGFGGLQDTRDAEQLSNVESAFDVLADNVEDVQRRGAPHRATEFKLYRATLGTGEQTTFSVTVGNWDSGDGTPVSASVASVPVVYRPEGSETTLRYLNGAVLRTERNGAVMLHDPPLVLRSTGGERTAVFPFVQTRADGGSTVSGSTTVLVRADGVTSETLVGGVDAPADTGDSRYDVALTVDTSPARASVWADHLNEEFEAAYTLAGPPCSTTGGTVTCTFETDRLFVSATRVDVSVED